jgi:hypothetical protein
MQLKRQVLLAFVPAILLLSACSDPDIVMRLPVSQT